MLAVGIFANGTYGAGWNVTTDSEMADSGKGVIGILGGDFSLGLGQLGAQAIGLLVDLDGDLRHRLRLLQDPERGHEGRHPLRRRGDEIAGMDLPEMGALAYPEFEFAIEHSDPEIGERPLVGSTGGSLPHEETPTRPRPHPLRPLGGHGSTVPAQCASRPRPAGLTRRMDIAEILRHILIVLVAAKLAAEIAERIGIPAVVGEIVAGILIGPSLLDAGRRAATRCSAPSARSA